MGEEKGQKQPQKIAEDGRKIPTTPVVQKNYAEDVIIRLSCGDDFTHFHTLPHDTAKFEFVVEVLTRPKQHLSTLGLTPILSQRPNHGSSRHHDGRASATIADGKVRKRRRHLPLPKDGLPRVDDVVRGAGEVSKVAYVHGQVKRRFCVGTRGAKDWCRVAPWTEMVDDGGSHGAAGFLAQSCKLI